MNVIPNKECILIIHKFALNCIFRIKSDSSSAEFARYGVINSAEDESYLIANSAEDESDLIRNIQFNSNLCISNPVLKTVLHLQNINLLWNLSSE